MTGPLWTFPDLVAATKGRPIGAEPRTIDGISIDSMTVLPGDVFVAIRGERMSVPLAIVRQIDHYGYHIGQIMLIARILAGDNWKVLSIPRGQSRQYNERIWKRN